MMRVVAAHAHVQRRAERVAQRAKEVRYELGWKCADLFARKLALEDEIGAAAQVERDRGLGLVHWQKEAVAPDTALVAECLCEGCAEVLYRRFDHGLVLANGSAVSPYTFDIAKIGGGRRYRRFLGAQNPDVNNGQPTGPRLTLPPLDGLLLKAE